MLRQDINLYRYFIKPVTRNDLFNWKFFIYLNILFTLLMIIIFISSIVSHIGLADKVKAANLKISNYQSELTKAKSVLPSFLFNKDLTNTIKDLQAELATERKIIGVLSMRNPFSQSFRGLSDAIVPNVWLTRFAIEKSGGEIMLYGNSIGMRNLQDYIERLKSNKVFGAFSVTVKSINNMDLKNANTKLSFELNMVKNGN